jgi:hypothetical protein
MQTSHSRLDRSDQAKAVSVPPRQPQPLDAASLKLVAGGLPRIGGLAATSPSSATALPQVS